MMIKIDKITKKYGKRALFSNFSYVFPDKGLVAIVGESGSGKSTLLNIISGLDFSYDGIVTVKNKNLKNFNDNELCNFRIKNIGYVFQNFNLLNLDSVFDNVYLPLDTTSAAKDSIKKLRVKDCLKLVGLEKMSKKVVNKLSGGEKQRVAIARAIVNNPDIILCDEPTGALDEKNSNQVFELLSKISTEKLVIIATHDVASISKISDVILELKNQKIVTKPQQIIKNNEKPLLIETRKNKRINRVSILFKLRNSFQKIKSKKYRSLVVNIMLSLSLTGVGMSLIISSSVSNKVNDAFESILNGHQVLVTTKNENESALGVSYAAQFDDVNQIYTKYKYHFEGIGVHYQVNFEDFFRDKNNFHLEGGLKNVKIESLSTRNINEYKWLDPNDNLCYPFSVEALDDDQVVLGLSYSDMVNICYLLSIQRNYTSLGHFIYEKGLSLVLNVENSFWQYDDEQIFEVVGVCESNNSCLYHTNQLWNEVVFEKMMKLPSDDDDEHDFPWEMYKIYYFKTKEDPQKFLDTSFYDEDLNNFIFERINNSYNPTLCPAGEVCNEKRIFVYSADKYFVPPSIVNSIGLGENYFMTSDFGYASYASNLFSGFSKNVFVSLEDELIDKAIDADTQIQNETNISIDLPDGVVQGNFLNSVGNGLRFSTLMDKLLYGRKPSNLNEIVISKGLGETLDKKDLCLGKYLTFAGEISEKIDINGNIEKEYNTSKLLVVGVVDESKNYIYHNQNWTISYFRDKLGVSSFYLIPKSIIFEFKSDEKAVQAFNKLKDFSNQYKIINPLTDLKGNIDSTLDYANTILMAFSILSTIISTLLLATVIMLNIIESKEEVRLYKTIGISKRNINSIFTFHGVLQGLLAFGVSAVELVVVDLLISYLIGDFLNIGFKFSLNSKPILIVFLMSIFIPFFISKIMLLFMNRKKQKS